jgi:hypothetical protein
MNAVGADVDGYTKKPLPGRIGYATEQSPSRLRCCAVNPVTTRRGIANGTIHPNVFITVSTLMTPIRRVATFRVDDDVLEAMRRLQERDGMPLSEQIRRALRPWLEAKGVIKEADRKRAAARKRP